ncbi:septal ring lytic transglycosylase RlpA family protein [Methyloceanibacter caenitepidi]|uniref:Endolytic peptidoglycan transglycosylase RlpA n=1 Tax=Methyloceanibacter caenitepidi TaxID=1384459 RepID=A0A0A8K3Z6_9HYPH|nr:septal ring lytic transglycosylase RlpA family protein [Methyloceanibacter caenitepidi]BAQ17630.1 rare lipoprotein A precursor [Methyloceanibacter caenitepidi]
MEQKPDGLGKRYVQIGESAPKGGGHFKIGDPYEIEGVRYVPEEDPSYDQRGVASWYGDLFHGRKTANGEIFDMERLSAAHPTLPLPVYVKVTNLDNGLSAVVRVNDRGPFRDGRLIDLSRHTAEVLGFKRSGTANVRVRYLRKASLDGDDTFERDYLSTRGYSQYAGTTDEDGLAEVVVAVGPPGPPAPPPLPDRPDRSSIAVAQAEPEPAPMPTVIRAAAAADAKFAVPEAPQADMATTGAIGSSSPDELQGPMIQAGFFKNEANAQRALSALAGVGPVLVEPIAEQGETYYRVRVGPFVDGITAAAALSDVADAGYRGAKIILQN